MAEFLAVLTLNFRPVLWLGTITRKVADLLAVAAGDSIRVARLITLFRHVVLGATVAASPRGTGLHVGTLFNL